MTHLEKDMLIYVLLALLIGAIGGLFYRGHIDAQEITSLTNHNHYLTGEVERETKRADSLECHLLIFGETEKGYGLVDDIDIKNGTEYYARVESIRITRLYCTKIN